MAEGLRLHIGCGPVYLVPDWLNADVNREGCALASEFPQGVADHGTTEDRYYANFEKIDASYLGHHPPDNRPIVCDIYGTWMHMPLPDGSVKEVLSRQTFEHLSKIDAGYAAAELRRITKKDAILRLDVPDHEASLEAFCALRQAGKHAEADFMKRHLLGSRKNDWSYHMGSWTRNKLIRFWARYGFEFVCEEPNIHFYPAFCLRFKKLPKCDFPELDRQIIPWKAAYEYCGQPVGVPLIVPDDFRVLEIGPGRSPWPRATTYADIDNVNLARIKDDFASRPGQDWPDFFHGSVEALPKEWTGKFDFVLASHILEHVPDPEKAASEINRVAKGGCVVCPSPMKESLFNYHEQDHKWMVQKWKNELHFYRIPTLPDGRSLWAALYDPEISGEMHRIWRYGERRIETVCNTARAWFHDHEPRLDVVHHFHKSTGGLQIKVFE